MAREPSNLGGSEGVYDGTRHTGQITRMRDGWLAQLDNAPIPLGTYATHAEAARAIFEADSARRKS
jgi:hypothetical protein